jgi:acyl-CoA thioesterase
VTPAENFMDLVGIRSAGRTDEGVVYEADVGPQHLNPYGVAHGGVAYAMVDTSMGSAVVAELTPDEACATIEVKIVYLAAAREGPMRCTTRLIQRTKRIAALESEVRQGERLVAKALGTFAIFERRV